MLVKNFHIDKSVCKFSVKSMVKQAIGLRFEKVMGNSI